MSTSFQSPPASGNPVPLSGNFDLSANILTLQFSEAVQWSALTNLQFTGTGNGGGTFGNSVMGAATSNATQSINCVVSSLSGVTGLLSYAGSPAQIVSTATGLPVLPFTAFPITLSF